MGQRGMNILWRKPQNDQIPGTDVILTTLVLCVTFLLGEWKPCENHDTDERGENNESHFERARANQAD
jgi:hypothetical protein